MTETLAAEVLSKGMLYFGGPAVIIALASIVSAYNNYKTRKMLSAYLQEQARRT